ncbi:MAG: phosphate ABC transporter ATP-binding protein [Bacteroidetes bacterium SW_4_67_19]|nr:MAG: phosphate ABC transporter ATP-binding protein [Bacteroidetes bacterium SW_4_67_19]
MPPSVAADDAPSEQQDAPPPPPATEATRREPDTAPEQDRERAQTPKVKTENLSFWYDEGDTQALDDITMAIQPNEVTAFIGPSGCGKSTLLRCFNRMNDLVQGTQMEGRVLVDGEDIYQKADPIMVRRRVGMVFQKPNPFPKSIRQNILWGARINGFTGDEDALVERSLRQAAIWDEVNDRLDASAYGLSGGQQQRLCIARALAVRPDVILMDEPTSALDPQAAAKVEETITELKKRYTIVIVTHNMQQASRISDATAFMYLGWLVEMSHTEKLFTRPEHQRTEDYITGRFG